MTGDPYAWGERIDRVVSAHARQRPGAIAVQQGDAEVSYRELWAQSEVFAQAVADAGVIIAVHMRRSPTRVAVLLGVLRAGSAYLPLDPQWPVERVDDVITRSGVTTVVTDDAGRFAGSRLSVVLASDPGPVSSAAIDTSGDGTATASVFYTSGSTGRPKGVLSPHRGACRVLVNSPTIPMDARTVLLQAAPVPWDMHSFELWGALLNGGRCVLMERDQPVLDLQSLRVAIDRGVNTLWLTSSLCNVFADEFPEIFARVRLLAIGGERASARHLRRILAVAPDLHLVNTYGPAECSMAATSHVVRAGDLECDDVPIGRPLARTGVVLLPDTGEIVLSGDGLAGGYLNDPEETERRFFEEGGNRFYRTGDVGELAEDGTLRYRGRLDRQFKVRGIRVEPGEVETVIRAYASVRSCVVLPVRGPTGENEVTCFYTTADGVSVDATDLRAFADRRLLDAMIPNRFQHVAQMPLTANGKVDLPALRRLLPSRRTEEAAADPLLAEIRRMLGLLEVTADDDLLASGATSLDAIRLAARLTARLGIGCTVADIYRGRSLKRIVADLTECARPAAAPLQMSTTTGPAVLSHAQARFWMAEETGPGKADNLLVLVYLLTGPLDVDRLKNALLDVVARNPILRTVYHWRGNDPVPEERSGDVVWETVDVAPYEDDIRAAAERFTADWWDRCFSLEDELPIRVRLGRLDERCHLLCLHVHHVAFDGWSQVVFMRELASAYRAGRAIDGGGDDPVAYRDYAAWERLNLPLWRRTDLPFWRDRLSDVPSPFLPRPPRGEATRLEREISLPSPTAAALAQSALVHGGPPVAALLAAVARAAATVFSVPDVCLGTVTAGRFEPGTERTIGYFVNPLTVPVTAAAQRPLAMLLSEVARDVVASLEHARIPFDDIVRELRPSRSRHPWFQTWVVLQGNVPSEDFGDSITAEWIRVRPPRTAIELMFEAFPQADGSWTLVMFWRADGIPTATAEALLNEVESTLAVMAHGTCPAAPVASLPSSPTS